MHNVGTRDNKNNKQYLCKFCKADYTLDMFASKISNKPRLYKADYSGMDVNVVCHLLTTAAVVCTCHKYAKGKPERK